MRNGLYQGKLCTYYCHSPTEAMTKHLVSITNLPISKQTCSCTCTLHLLILFAWITTDIFFKQTYIFVKPQSGCSPVCVLWIFLISSSTNLNKLAYWISSVEKLQPDRWKTGTLGSWILWNNFKTFWEISRIFWF